MCPGTYSEHTMEPVLDAAAWQFPAVVLTGPRQSGKTTVLRRLFGARYEYVALEALDTRAPAAEDPRAFLRLHQPPVIPDEVQQVSESPAGRAAILKLLRSLCASGATTRGGQILDRTGIATELGLTLNTVKAWTSVLLASYQIVVLQPYHAELERHLGERHATARDGARHRRAQRAVEPRSGRGSGRGTWRDRKPAVPVASTRSRSPLSPPILGAAAKGSASPRTVRRRDVKFSCVSCCTGNGQAVECHNGPARKGVR